MKWAKHEMGGTDFKWGGPGTTGLPAGDGPAGVATHSLSNQAVMNFRDLRNIEAAFFIPACFALPYIT